MQKAYARFLRSSNILRHSVIPSHSLRAIIIYQKSVFSYLVSGLGSVMPPTELALLNSRMRPNTSTPI